MPRRGCNIIWSSGEPEESYLLQKSRTEIDEYEKNLKAKVSATTQVYFSVFPGLNVMNQHLMYI